MVKQIFFIFSILLFLRGSAQQAQPPKIRKLAKNSTYNIHPVFVSGGGTLVGQFELQNGIIETKHAMKSVHGFYLNRFEVSVADYLKFYYSCKAQATDTSYKALYPDTLVFFRAYASLYSEPAAQVYFWHPKFQNYAIVGISRQNAQAYCKWLEQRLREESVSILGEDIIKAVRLPTIAEWSRAVGKQDIDSVIREYIRNDYKGLNTGEIVTEYRQSIAGFGKDGYLTTNPVDEVEKNKTGIFNLMGNVAEFTSDTPRIYRSDMIVSSKMIVDLNDTLDTYNQNLLDSLSALEEEGDSYAIFKNYHLFKPNKRLDDVSKVKADGALTQYDISLVHTVITGASWKDDLRFLNPNRIRLISNTERKSYVGFRFVIEYK